MSHHQNLLRIKAVYEALGELSRQVIFIGGAAVSLYTDRKAEEVRPTDDIDVLIELTSYQEYSTIEVRLREKGFINDMESGIICRYRVNGITVDIMPTEKDILGFSNRWYAEGFKHSRSYSIEEGVQINILKAPYFLATKLEAFKGRGNNDGRWSTDFEDIVYLLNNCSTIWDEMAHVGISLKEYFLEEFTHLLSNPYIDEWIAVHLEYAEQNRTKYIIAGISDFIERNS